MLYVYAFCIEFGSHITCFFCRKITKQNLQNFNQSLTFQKQKKTEKKNRYNSQRDASTSFNRIEIEPKREQFSCELIFTQDRLECTQKRRKKSERKKKIGERSWVKGIKIHKI